MKKILAPIRHRDAYTRAVEKLVLDYFDETIYQPLIDLFDDAGVHIRENSSTDTIANALRSGRIWYAAGEFSGTFNATISGELRALGATFNRGAGTFTLTADKLPPDIRGAAAESLDKSKHLHEAIVATLDAMQINALIAVTGLDLKSAALTIVKDLNKQFKETTEAVYADVVSDRDSIAVPGEFTEATAEQMRKTFTENLDLAIKDFVQSDIPGLRAEVQANAFAGYRSEHLAEIIEARYGLTKRKAAFLADQETGLFVSKYREHRYRAAGYRTYKWSTSHDERVRSDHRLLDQTVHSWDSPPVTNRATGDRNHPGEDFRCRCVAMPILEFLE